MLHKIGGTSFINSPSILRFRNLFLWGREELNLQTMRLICRRFFIKLLPHVYKYITK
jgi:hypothetical protein